MPSSEESVEITITLDDGLLARIDRLCHTPGYQTRSDVVTAAIEDAEE